MKKLASMVLVTGMLVSGMVNAQCSNPEDCLPLNTIVYPLHVEQWATSQTAKVTIQFDGALTTKGSADIQSTIYQKLAQLSNSGKWYVTNVNQTKDSSDLQRITIQAEARLATSDLAGLQDKVKGLSKPGATFTVADIDFSPSMKDIQQVKTDLRSQMYQMAKEELIKFNQMYPDQKFVLHKIEIVESMPPVMMGGGSNNMMLAKMDGNSAPAPTPMMVNRKVQLDGRVEFASKLG